MRDAFRPRPWMVCVLAALPWLNPVADGPSAAVRPWLVSAACGLGLWLVAGGATTRLPWPRALAWACLALVAWAALAHPLRPELVMLAAGLVLFLLAASAAADDGIASGLQAGLLAAAAASAAIGLVQYFGGAALLDPLVSSAEAGEAYANLRQPNQYATLCWMGAAIVVFGTLRLPRPVAPALIVLLAIGSAASMSRTAMLQGAALAILALWWPGSERRPRLLLCLAGAGAYVAAAWLLPVLLEVVSGETAERTLWGRLVGGTGCFSRLVLWSNVLHLIALEPFTGWGWGELDFAHYTTLYAGPRFCEILDNAHNLPLHLAAELGVPAALLACGGALWWAWRQRPWQETVPRRQLAWTLLALILLHSLLEYPLWYGPFQIAFGLAVGWLGPRGIESTARGALHVPGAAAASLLVVALGYAAWDYTRVTQIYLPPEERRAAWRDDTLEHVRGSWLFSGQARFADLTLASPTRANAAQMYALSQEVLHYSPEPRVIERVIASATLLGREDEAVLHLARFRAAFPREYEAWRAEQRRPLPLLP
jgi:hypothetical protein